MSDIADQVKRIEGTIERRLNEHLQMLEKLQECAFCFWALKAFGNLEQDQIDECSKLQTEIEALIAKTRS